MTSTGPVEPGQIRVGDAQREQMVQRLQRAHANGQLDLAEYDARVQRAYEARVQSDLDVLVLDLPVEVVDPGGDRQGAAWASVDRRLEEARHRATQAHQKGKEHIRNAHSASGGLADRRGGSQGGVARTLVVVLGVLVALAVVSTVVGFVFKLVVPVLVIAGIVAIVRALRGS